MKVERIVLKIELRVKPNVLRELNVLATQHGRVVGDNTEVEIEFQKSDTYVNHMPALRGNLKACGRLL